jgi:hypothetical protein
MKNNTHLLKYLKFKKILICKNELENLVKAKTVKERNKLIRLAEDCVIDSISELAKNCLFGNIPLKNCDFNKLSKYQSVLRKLSKDSSVKKRKHLINQNGGFLNLLIPAAISFLIPLVKNLIQKKFAK